MISGVSAQKYASARLAQCHWTALFMNIFRTSSSPAIAEYQGNFHSSNSFFYIAMDYVA